MRARHLSPTILSVVALMFLLGGPGIASAANTWDGTGGNASWNTPENWDDDNTPDFSSTSTSSISFGTGFTSGWDTSLDGDKYMDKLTIAATQPSSSNIATIQPGTPSTSKLILQSGDLWRNGGTSGGRTVEIDTEVVLGADGDWYIYTPQSTTTVNGPITDGGSNRNLTIDGSNRVLRLNGDNTFGGDLSIANTSVWVGGDNSARAGKNIIESGALNVAHANALGSGDLIINGGGFYLKMGGGIDVTIPNDWEVNAGMFSYAGDVSSGEFIMTGALKPLDHDLVLRAAAGGGSSRFIHINTPITEVPGSNVTLSVSSWSHGSRPILNSPVTIGGDLVMNGDGGQGGGLYINGDCSGVAGDLIVSTTTSNATISILSGAVLPAGTFVIDAVSQLVSLQDDRDTTEYSYDTDLAWGGNIHTDQSNLRFTGPLTLTTDLTFHTGPANGILTLDGDISDDGNGFSINYTPESSRSGFLKLGGSNTFSGGVLIDRGYLEIRSDGAFGTGTFTVNNDGAVPGIRTDGGTYVCDNPVALNTKLDLQTSGTSVSFTGTTTVSGAYDLDVQYSTSTLGLLGGIAETGAGGYTLTKDGQGALVIGPSSYLAFSDLAGGRGMLVAAGNNALGTSLANMNFASGTSLGFQSGFDYTALKPVTVQGNGFGSAGAIRNVSDDNSFAGTVTMAADTRFGADAGSLALDGDVNGGYAITKIGNGTILFNGTVNTSSVAVNAGTVGGTGTITGPVTVSAGGIAPGASVGTLTVSGGNVSLTGATFTAELGGSAAGQYDRLDVTAGSVGISNSDILVDLTDGYLPKWTDALDVITASAAGSGNFDTPLIDPSDALVLANYAVQRVNGDQDIQLTQFDLFPLADIGLSSAGPAGILFSGLDSYDPDESPSNDIGAYDWLLDGAAYSVASFTQILNPGLHTVSLRVQDNEGNWGQIAELTFLVPEPSTGMLLALLGLGLARRQRGLRA